MDGYNSDMDLQPDSMILVAIMPKARDMEIARLFGWYRIPMKSAPKILHVDYAAFYQTSDFGAGHSSVIERYAPVLGVELTTRAELFRAEPDHPRAQELYYKLQLGELRTLPRPIRAGKWKRFLFIYTSGAQLSTAQTIHDLALTGAEHKVFWQALRERSLDEPVPYTQASTSNELLFLLGNLSVSQLDLSS